MATFLTPEIARLVDEVEDERSQQAGLPLFLTRVHFLLAAPSCSFLVEPAVLTHDGLVDCQLIELASLHVVEHRLDLVLEFLDPGRQSSVAYCRSGRSPSETPRSASLRR